MVVKYIKAIASGLIAILLLFAFSACGQQTTPKQTEQPEQTQQNETEQQEQQNETGEQNNNTIVVYFSATGNTETVAGYIADTLNADTYQIIAEQKYTSDDLDWTDDNSRVSTEHNDPDFRPEMAGELPDLTNYDTIFIGYPIWWGEAPNIVKGFVENVDFSNKVVIPFCTSSSSGIGSSSENLEALTSNANWLAGQRFSSSVSKDDIINWVNSLNEVAVNQ